MELRPAGPGHVNQAGLLQHVEMLGDRLAGEGFAVLRERQGADLEQRLVGPLAQPVDDPATGRIGKRLEDQIEPVILHTRIYAMILLHVNGAAASLIVQ